MNDPYDILAGALQQVEGAVAAAVGGTDGLLVEQCGVAGTDLAAATAVVANLLLGGASASETQLQGGPLRELILGGERRLAYARLLSQELFCLIVMDAPGDIDGARRCSEQVGAELLAALV